MPVSACAGRFGQNFSALVTATARLPAQRVWAPALLALLAGCQQLAPAAPTSTDAPIAESSPAVKATGDGNAFEQSQTYYQVLLGQLAQQRGEPQIALSNLLAAAEASRDIGLARQAFGLAMKQRDADATLRAANLLAELEPTNPEARMALALAQFQTEQTDAASVNLEQALALIGSNENGQLALLGKFARAGGPGTLPLLAELARQHPNPEWVLLATAVQAQHFGDGPYAMALLDRAMEQAPDYRRALLVKAELLANRDGSDAIALLDEAYRKHPNDRELTVAYGRLLYSQGRFNEATTVLRSPAKDPADQEASYLYAVSLFMAGEWADALPRLKSIAETGEQTGPAGWLCAQAAERLKQSAEALACYDRVQPSDSQYPPAQRARAELLSKAMRYDDALAGLGEARRQLDSQTSSDNEQKIRQQAGLLASQLRVLQQAKRLTDAQTLFEGEPVAYRSQPEPSLLFASLNQTNPDQILAAFREQRPTTASQRQQWALTGAGLLQEQGARQQAYALIDAELTEQPDNIELLYSRALLAETLADHARTEADLRRVLALDPNHIDGLNALGYTLADHNRELDEARDLVQRALRARPTSAAIMDSMGWVHFRRGELEQARDWLQRAYGLEPEAEIAAHYGEVLYRLGEKRKARNLWRDALEQDPSNAALKSVLERLK